MKKMNLVLSTFFLAIACNETDSTKVAPLQQPKPPPPMSQETKNIEDWQASTMGQEGHGGDAIVCFSIPIQQAVVKVNYGSEPCVPGGPCSSEPGNSHGTTWQMTQAGRAAIQSAKPLEQFLAEKISGKKLFLDRLNQMSVEQGYQYTLSSLTQLPAPFKRISEMHQRLGWLKEDGIASEYGLMDINDSGFLDENEIDKNYCKELQAVVRRDNQLWYDRDIIKHFDNAGLVLIQLHEELYSWGKNQDKINWQIAGMPSHENSTKTRRAILKILDDNIDAPMLNEILKTSGFSIANWEDYFKVPTPMGYFMDSDSCVQEKQFLKAFLQNNAYGTNFRIEMMNLLISRYIDGESHLDHIQARFNYPDALSHLILMGLESAGNEASYRQRIFELQDRFERSACAGSFNP